MQPLESAEQCLHQKLKMNEIHTESSYKNFTEGKSESLRSLFKI